MDRDQFLTTRVWCQPAAWSGEVISCWISDLVHEYQKQCVTVLDCFSGQWTETSLFTSWLNSQMQLPIGPDCTPLLQVTDTCQSAQGKAAGFLSAREQDCHKVLADGFSFVATGSDLGLIARGADALVKLYKP